MDTNNTIQSGNFIPARTIGGGALGYDLNSEKSAIEEITKETRDELLRKWKKSYANAQIFPASVTTMHPDARDFLLSFDLVSVYDAISKQAGLDAKGRNSLSQIVWQIAVTKNWNNLDQELEAKIPLVHSAHVQVVELLQQNIINKIKTISEKPILRKVVEEYVAQKKQIQLSLSEALSKYSKLGEQGITSNQLKLRYLPTPVRPSIKNWITDFHDAMGSGKHSPIDRGNFLFHSENGKALSAVDRQKVAIILKSLDEQTPLKIDEEAQCVVFETASNAGERVEEVKPVATNFVPMQSAPRASMQSAPEMQIMKNEAVDNFFSIPTSKPPMGSSEFNIEKVKEDGKVFSEKKENFESPKEKTMPIESQSDEQKNSSFISSFASKIFPEKKVPEIAEVKIEEVAKKETRANVSPTFVSPNSISFSSPQKLSIEKPDISLQANQRTSFHISPAADSAQQDVVESGKPVLNEQPVVEQESAKQEIEETRSVPQFQTPPSRAMYHIGPARSTYREDNVPGKTPKINGNVVDLS